MKDFILSIFSKRLLTLLGVVVVFGGLLGVDLSTKPEALGIPSKTWDREDEGARKPASEATEIPPPSILREANHVESIPWDCKTSKITQKFSNVTQLRLFGSCLRWVKAITNKNNGYTANIFNLEKNFTTDFIWLDQGVNQLSVEWIENVRGNPPEIIEITMERL